MSFNWPLMENNITEDDLQVLINFLQTNPILTQSSNVRAFEQEWSEWVGMKYSVFINSGSSANLLSMNVIKLLYGTGEIIVPPLTWVSDIASVLQCGFKPVFVDIDPRTLCMDPDEILKKITPQTKAVFLTHVQGFNGLTQELLDELEKRQIPLIEDVCESHGAAFKGRKVGSFGFMSNFSYYYAHHMSTIEGGMVCTNDEKVYQMLRMLRSHGMVREANNDELKKSYVQEYPELNSDFIFAFPAYNFRNTEIGGVLGRNQLKHLDANNAKRIHNFEIFLQNLDANKYYTDFDLEGSCNYALNLVIRKPDMDFCEKVMQMLRDNKVEFRRGSAGGGNQTRQPYLKDILQDKEYLKYPHTEHIHFFGFYIGNYPNLPEERILWLCKLLNAVE
ncbi:MAG: DegT/DnrJ/EryC1/StrS family aminotransferase [SAR324 cluster bacterium]|nr:DegT/DnrJ/EryC1/StrS family aminotransferase [SAR324 cluster bacterium]